MTDLIGAFLLALSTSGGPATIPCTLAAEGESGDQQATVECVLLEHVPTPREIVGVLSAPFAGR